MKKLLQEISVIPGVAGSCIFDKNKGPLCNDLNPDLSKDLLQTIGTHLVRLIQIGGMSSMKVKSVSFRFDKYSVVGMPLKEGSVLLTICESQANCSLVATTAALLAADMRDKMDEKNQTAETLSDADQETKGSATVDLRPTYTKIEQALTDAIGPVAGILMQDYIEKWKESGPESTDRLAELTSMLAQEIGDQNLIKAFTSKLADIS